MLNRNRSLSVALGALGVVFGDIGTSPLYAFRASFELGHASAASSSDILGILSLIFWALIITISIKYLGLVLRADNQGEGGILALMELVLPEKKSRRGAFVVLGLFGAALLYGDGTITPAISVLSAVEGVQTAAPGLSALVVPIALVILVLLFLLQQSGSSRIGHLFGPVMVVWFLAIGLLGLGSIVREPVVLTAVSPLFAVRFIAVHGIESFLILGGVFLAVTGGEALYADLGHFGRRPIRQGWFMLVLPCLLLNYFGQGALLLGDPKTLANPFYLLAPQWALVPLLLLAMVATVIASQAIISGVFSLTFQAQQLGYLPRMRVRHTSEDEPGQIYLPQVNWLLFVATAIVMIGFGSSENLSSAYGLAVSGTMVITTLLAYFAFRRLWKWRLSVALPVAGFFLIIDLSFLGANLLKLESGGWYPILVGIVLYACMSTWAKGQEVIGRQIEGKVEPLASYIARLDSSKVGHVAGTAIYLSRGLTSAPLAFVHNVTHNKIVHERVIFMSVAFRQVPHVRSEDRLELLPLPGGFYRLLVQYGFMDRPNIRGALRIVQNKYLDLNLEETTFFVGSERLVPSRHVGMSIWRDFLYLFLSRNSQRAIDYFNLPADRVFEIGAQIKF